MSDLQISLLAIGALVVGGVFLYNWIQERRFRRRFSEAFGERPEDVLLEEEPAAPSPELRHEPQLDPVAEIPEHTPGVGEVPGAAVNARQVRAAAPGAEFDPVLDCIAEISADRAIPDTVISELVSKVAACGRPARAAGLDPRTGAWETLDRGIGARYTSVKFALQMVNRSGQASTTQLAMFCDAISSAADKAGGRASLPDVQALQQGARDLDAFCSTVDVAIGVNIVAAEGSVFSGTKIRALAESAGFKLEPDGVFHFRDEQRQTLFTLDNHEPAPFLPEQIKTLATSGITVLLDVPRVADGLDVLDRMVDIARALASSLGGRLVDDNRVELSDAGIARIGQQLSMIRSTMERTGIPAGSPRALRLFS